MQTSQAQKSHGTVARGLRCRSPIMVVFDCTSLCRVMMEMHV